MKMRQTANGLQIVPPEIPITRELNDKTRDGDKNWTA